MYFEEYMKYSEDIWGYDVIPNSSLPRPGKGIGNKQIGVRRY